MYLVDTLSTKRSIEVDQNICLPCGFGPYGGSAGAGVRTDHLLPFFVHLILSNTLCASIGCCPVYYKILIICFAGS